MVEAAGTVEVAGVARAREQSCEETVSNLGSHALSWSGSAFGRAEPAARRGRDKGAGRAGRSGPHDEAVKGGGGGRDGGPKR